MRALLASPLGFLIGLALGALGGGGSIVAVPALVYVAGEEPAAATATSLMIVGAAAAAGVVGHARAGVGEEHALTDTDRSGTEAGAVALRTARRIDVAVAWRVALVGTAVGFLTGLFGVGGGFVIVPALTLVLGFTMPEAVGTSLLVIAINAVTGLAVRVGTGGIEWSVAVPFTAAALAGVITGASIASRIDAGALVRWFAASLVALSLYITTGALISLAR